jgi:peptidase E
LATSGGLAPGHRTRYEFGPLLRLALDLSGAARPSLCYVGTAVGDDPCREAEMLEAARQAGVACHPLRLFPMPNVADIAAYLQEHSVVWVGGGSVANLLALWRLHGVDDAMRQAWEAGVVLAGVSAGSICWHVGGTTDSFGPDLAPIATGLGLVPYANGVHYDTEPGRRPLLQRLVREGALPKAYATEDGVGLLYEGTSLVEAVTEAPGKVAYHLWREHGKVVEVALETRLLS